MKLQLPRNENKTPKFSPNKSEFIHTRKKNEKKFHRSWDFNEKENIENNRVFNRKISNNICVPKIRSVCPSFCGCERKRKRESSSDGGTKIKIKLKMK